MAAPLILFVGRDAQTYTFVRRLLLDEGLLLELGSSDLENADALQLLRADLIVMDLDLPKHEFSSAHGQLRTVSDAPIIVLSESGSIADKIQTLDKGASDYIIKPFSGLEFVARVRVVLRRRKTVSCAPQTIDVCGLSINQAAGQVLVDGNPVQLTERELRVLATLAAAGRTLRHRDIIHAAWGRPDAVNTEYLRVCIMALRRKLGSASRLIVTHPGVGYSLLT
jgi:DNA-binding response OmpR family regulator